MKTPLRTFRLILLAVIGLSTSTFPAFAQLASTVLSFQSVAELRGQNTAAFGTTAPHALTGGYYVAGDGGGNKFIWSGSSTAADNGGTVIKPEAVAEASPGRWLATAENMFNVKVFGAVGDGAIDDSAKIQNALNEAQRLGIGSVILPLGTYVAEDLKPPSNIQIRGPGTLLHKPNSPYPLISLLQATQNVILEDLELDGGNAANEIGDPLLPMISVKGRNHAIRHCHLHDFKGSAIVVTADAGNDTNYILITENLIEEVQRYGIQLHSSGSLNIPQDVMIKNNRVYRCSLAGGSHSIAITNTAKRVTVQGNHVRSTQTSGSGIEGYDEQIEDLQIIGNYVEDCGWNGSHVGGRRVVVKGNIYRNILRSPILLSSEPNEGPTPRFDFIVSDNMIHTTTNKDTSGTAIQVRNMSHGIVADNIIVDPGCGILIGGFVGTPLVGEPNEDREATDVTVTGNTVKWTNGLGAGPGIHLKHVKRINCVGNTVRDCPATGIKVEGDALSNIEDVNLSSNIVTGCVIGIQVAATNRLRIVVKDNIASNTSDYDTNYSNVLQVGNVWGTSSGHLINDRVTINKPVANAELLLLATERPWSFYQRGALSAARLSLENVTGKQFGMTNQTPGAMNIEFFPSDTGAYIKINGKRVLTEP